jgi:hypothetical protein
MALSRAFPIYKEVISFTLNSGIAVSVLPLIKLKEEKDMNGSCILNDFRFKLAQAIALENAKNKIPEPLAISPWMAMSLLQKAIRRGHIQWALAAAVTLLDASPDRLWRRLCVTAYEDIGIADLDLVADISVSLKGKTVRKELGGEWSVANHLIRRMCATPKCRAADDLMIVAERSPQLIQQRFDMTFMPIAELMKIAASAETIESRAIALWYAIGTDRCPSDRMRLRKGDPATAFDMLAYKGYPDTVVETAREAFRKSNEMMPVLLSLLVREWQSSECKIIPDELPQETMIGRVPCWVLDMHVREGNRAMTLLLKRGGRFAKWHDKHVGSSRGVRVMGSLLFRIESGLVDRRINWEIGNRVRAQADYCFPGLDPDLAAEGRTILLEDLPQLNEARADVIL